MKRTKNRTHILAIAALAGLLVSACTSAEADADAGDAAAVDVESTPEAVEEADEDELTEGRPEVEDYESVPFSEEHLAEGVEMTDCVAARDDIYVSPDAQLTESDLAAMCPENEVRTECTDPEALAANEGHEPAGWPQDWEEGEPLPDPECHPDFIEIYAWDQFDTFFACWEGPETGSMVRTPGMSDQDVYDAEWDSSQLRAEWEQPGLEEWEDLGMTPDEASPECGATY